MSSAYLLEKLMASARQAGVEAEVPEGQADPDIWVETHYAMLEPSSLHETTSEPVGEVGLDGTWQRPWAEEMQVSHCLCTEQHDKHVVFCCGLAELIVVWCSVTVLMCETAWISQGVVSRYCDLTLACTTEPCVHSLGLSAHVYLPHLLVTHTLHHTFRELLECSRCAQCWTHPPPPPPPGSLCVHVRNRGMGCGGAGSGVQGGGHGGAGGGRQQE